MAAVLGTFREKFAAMVDTYNGVYLPLQNTYGPNLHLNAEELLRRTATRWPVDQVPAVFIYQDQHNALRVLHHIHQVETPFGQPQNPLTDAFVGFISDIYNATASVLQVPPDFFATTGNIAVPTSATLTALLAIAENEIVGPFNHNDPDTEIINTRRSVPVPHAYVGLVLFRTLSPREAWQQLGQQIIMDGREEDCAVLINFLKAATVAVRGQGRAQPDLPPITCQPVALTPPYEGPVLEHIHRKLCLLLPGAFAPPIQGGNQPENQAVAIAEGFANMRADRRLEQEAAAEAALTAAEVAATPKSFSDVFATNALSIRQLCMAGNDDDLLPDFWRTFAANKGKKGPGMSNFSQLTLRRSKAQDSARIRPIVSTQLYVNISSFEIGATDLEVITQGVSPFLMCPDGYVKANETTLLTQEYMMLQGENGARPALSDVKQLVPATAYNVPEDMYSLVDFIGAYSVVWDVLVGEHHPLAILLRQHHRFWVENIRHVLKALPEDRLRNVVMIGTLRHIQLEVLQYVNAIMYDDEAAPLPDLYQIEKDIKSRRFLNLPSLPASYTQPMSLSKIKLPPYPPHTPVPPASRNPLTGTGPSVEVVAPTGDRNQKHIDEFEASQKSIQDLRNVVRQPRVKNSITQLCLSYHLKGSCFDVCKKSKTHRKLDKVEEDNMQRFLTSNL